MQVCAIVAPRDSLTKSLLSQQCSVRILRSQKQMYAIIEEGGKQYKVTSGDTILIDRQLGDEKSIKFDRVLLVGGEGEPKIGLPTVSNVTVSADVVGEEKGDKITIQKYKRRKGYHKKIGHRQRYVRVKITGINV